MEVRAGARAPDASAPRRSRGYLQDDQHGVLGGFLTDDSGEGQALHQATDPRLLMTTVLPRISPGLDVSLRLVAYVLMPPSYTANSQHRRSKAVSGRTMKRFRVSHTRSGL